MIHFLKEELNGIYQFLKRNGNETVIIASAALFFTLDRYHPLLNDWLSSFFYYAILPVSVIIFILWKNPMDFGLRLGSPRIWGGYVIITCLISAAVLYLSSFSPSLQSYYRMSDFNLLTYFLTNCVILASQEFIYRGYLLFGLMEKFKEGSILIQMVPFVLLHLGKPELETISTIITGILFGYICYRGKSYWPAFIIHLFINVFFVGLINLRFS
jgi:membrane protease YdiL (CAAX protease family)